MTQDYTRILTNLEKRLNDFKARENQLEGAIQAAKKSLNAMGLSSPEEARKYLIRLEGEKQELENELDNSINEIREILDEYESR